MKVSGSRFFKRQQFHILKERESKKREESETLSSSLSSSSSQMPLLHLSSPSTRPGQQRPRPSMLMMPLAVAAARRARATSASALYSMRRCHSPLLSQLPSRPATPAIRRPFAVSPAILSPPRGDKRLGGRLLNGGQSGAPLKAAAGAASAAASALPSHCSGCGVSLQGNDPDLPG